MNEQLVKRVAKLRAAKCWSETDLAREANLSQSTVNCWNYKTRNPSIASLEKVSKVLDVSLCTLLNDGDVWYDITEEELEILTHFRELPGTKKRELLGFISSDLNGRE